MTTPFVRRWLAVTGTAAACVTAVGAALLQRSRGFFTGGFLSVDHLETPSQMAAFFGASFLVDAAVAGITGGVVLWLLSRARLRVAACVTGALLAAAVPLLVAEAVSYQVFRYLGDAFDLGLMFDLTGGSVAELLAVSSSQLVAPAVLIAVAAFGGAALVFLVNRFAGGRRAEPARASELALVPGVCLAALAVLGYAIRSDAALENGLLRKASGALLAAAGDTVTDADRDGFGLFGRMRDPAPFDRAVFPYALDRPGNGIDEDGIAGDLAPDAPPYAQPAVPDAPWQRRPDVVLITLESFRADLIGRVEHGRPVTPVIDAIARRGISASQAYSHNGYTVQSRYHLMTGLLLPQIGAPSLIDDFRRHGYVTGFFSAQDESFGGAEYGCGFDRADVAIDARDDRDRRYSTSTTPGSLVVPHTVVEERVTRFLDDHAASTMPLFVYLNFQDTHFPYTHDSLRPITSDVRLARSEIGPGTRDRVWATYANAAANVDAAIGDVLAAVRRARGSEPAIIITSDHGESLFDEGFLGHGYGLNDAQTRIPFIAANLPLTITEPFGQTDVRAAVNAAMAAPPDAAAMPVIAAATGRPVFQYLGEVTRPRQIAFVADRQRLIYDFRTRLVWVPGSRRGAGAPGPLRGTRPATPVDGGKESGWQEPATLAPADAALLQRLVQQWEQMKVADDSGRADAR